MVVEDNWGGVDEEWVGHHGKGLAADGCDDPTPAGIHLRDGEVFPEGVNEMFRDRA